MGGPAEAGGLSPGGVSRNQQQRTAQTDPQRFIQHRAQHQQRSRQEQEAEHAFEQVHPGARFGQEAIADGHQQQQRHTDADTHGEQNQPAVQRVTALRNVEQGAGQRGGHARADQQTGQGAQYASTDEAAAALIARNIFQAVTHGHRQLQFEEPEHRQRQQHKNRGETAQQPRVLQQRLKVCPEQRGQHAHRRIHQRHADHITAGQGKTALGRGATADDQPGENRQHRQRTRGEGQQQTQAEKHQQTPAQRPLLEVAGQCLIRRFVGR